MRLMCSICQDIYIPCSIVHVTNCGHLYHADCLSTWTNKHKTCPQCRTSLTQPFRIYFDVEKGEDTDRATLERQIEVVLDKLRTSERKNRNLMQEKKSLDRILMEMHENAQSLTKKNNILDYSLSTLKEEITRLNGQTKTLTRLESEVESLKAKISILDRVNTLIEGTTDEVNQLVDSTPVTALAVKQLCTYVSVLKSQLNKMENKNFKLAKEYNDLAKALSEEKKKNFNGTEELIKSLQEKNKKLEDELKSANETLENYKKKYYRKLNSLAPLRNRPNQGHSSKNFPDIEEFLEDDNRKKKTEPKQKTETVRPADPDRAIRNWEEIIYEGKHIPGFAKTKARSFGTALNERDEQGTSRLDEGYAFDGMGGRKKIRLGGPTPPEEFKRLKQKKSKRDGKGTESRQKQIPECINVE